jgi:hypothetical protein
MNVRQEEWESEHKTAVTASRGRKANPLTRIGGECELLDERKCRRVIANGLASKRSV